MNQIFPKTFFVYNYISIFYLFCIYSLTSNYGSDGPNLMIKKANLSVVRTVATYIFYQGTLKSLIEDQRKGDCNNGPKCSNSVHLSSMNRVAQCSSMEADIRIDFLCHHFPCLFHVCSFMTTFYKTFKTLDYWIWSIKNVRRWGGKGVFL